MARHVGNVFTGVTVLIDDNEYIDCTFDQCTMQYNGGLWKVDNCRFINCGWGFGECAARTFQFVSALNQAYGSGGQPGLVDAIFDALRMGQFSTIEE